MRNAVAPTRSSVTLTRSGVALTRQQCCADAQQCCADAQQRCADTQQRCAAMLRRHTFSAQVRWRGGAVLQVGGFTVPPLTHALERLTLPNYNVEDRKTSDVGGRRRYGRAG
jgi:hypothetical protein